MWGCPLKRRKKFNMKILFCHDHIFKEYEGEYYSPGKISIEQMESYQSLGDNITIVARSNKVTSLDSSKHNQITHNRVSFCAFPNASNFKSLILRKELLKKAVKIASQYDIIIARLPSEIGSIFAQAGRKLNKPVLIEVVACVWDNLYYFGTIKAKLYAPLAYVRMRNLVKQADFVHYVTSSFLQKRYPTKKGALTLSASDVILSTVSNSQRNLKKNNEISIGVVGSMDNKIKGISLAIKAVKILSNSTNEKITLHIIGPGDKKKYQNLASRLNLLENINFVGSLSDSKAVQKYLNEYIDIYIQPSYQEGMPRAVLEAMSCGIPCIVSCAGGMPEIISSDYVHAKGDYKQLAHLIKKISSSEKIYRQESEKNHLLANKFSHERLIYKKNKFYNLIKDRISEGSVYYNKS